ncbi:syntaxin-32 isoform X2 [Coffea arabica]|uniref:Syntaxin-32 isoform X2 n=1 Tax=Coffea arabica TaxID=13443 RepID=A0A6P6SI17_COFAR|nr:syntaxin-32-like isoform X2 [Coffea arabica]
MPVKTTSYRDRTHEFESLVEKLKKPSSLSPASTAPSSSSGGGFDGNPTSAPQETTRSAAPIQSEFNKRASRIALGIHQTSQKLSKLAKLAKKTSVFDDPTLEIQELTTVIKQDITALNSAVVDLQLLSNSQNEGNLSSDSSAHSTTVVDNLKNSLMTTTKEFKEVLTLRTENMKVHENRRQLFSSSASKESSNPFIRQRPLATRAAASAAISPPPWASEPSTSSQLFPRQKVNHIHCFNNNKVNSSWLHCRTISFKAEPLPFKMLSQQFMSWAISSPNWQQWFLSRVNLQSELTKTWKIPLQVWKVHRAN